MLSWPTPRPTLFRITGTVGVVDNPARNAVQAFANITLVGGALGDNAFISIPAGKIFVIEFASLYASVPGGTVESLGMFVTAPQTLGPDQPGHYEYELVIPPPDSAGFIHGSQTVRLYAQGGTNIQVHFGVTGSNGSRPPNVMVSLSGYLVSAQ